MIALAAFTFLAAVDLEPKPRAEVRTTQHFDLPAGGTVRLGHSIGELDVEAWDRTDVEVTIVKSAKPERAAVLDRVHVAMERKGDELVIRSEYPRHKVIPHTDFEIEYHINAPRGARLAIDHDDGQINLDGMTGDIRAINHCGDIALRLPDGAYAIDARSKLGAVTSDFAGEARSRHWLGEEFDRTNTPPAANLYLRIECGDIIILKMRRPAPPSRFAAPSPDRP